MTFCIRVLVTIPLVLWHRSLFHNRAYCLWRVVISIEFRVFKGSQLAHAQTSG